MSKQVKTSFDFALPEFDADDEDVSDTKVIKRKKVEVKPMNEEEAILQMELLGHEFFVYKDVERDTVCILYKRKDSNYGIIETR